MEKVISLIKTDFNITFGLSSMVYSFKNKKNRWQIILIGFAFLSLIPTYFMLISGLVKIYDAYRQIGQQSMFLLNGFLASQMLVFLFGLLYVMSKYYFSNDLNQLVPLPIKPSYIVGSKFVTLMFSEYLTSLPIILPFIIIYGIKGSEGIVYWIYSLLLTLTLPALPLVLASILVMIFMRYTNVKGKKDLIRIVGAVLFLIILFFFQFKIQSIAQKALMKGDNFFFDLVRDSNLLVKRLGLAFPPSMWGSLALSNYSSIKGFLYLLLFIGIAVGGLILMLFLSEKLFYDGLIGNIEVSAAKGKGSRKVDLNKSTKETNPSIAIALKEIKLLFRTPIYLINSIGGVIIVPIILVMSTFVDGGESMEPIRLILEGKPYLITLFGIGLIIALGMLSSIGCTTFSREGKNFWIQRTLPIKVEDQIYGRVMASLIIQLMGLVVLLVSMSFITNIGLSSIFWISLLGLLGSIPMTQLGMTIDILRPLLDWDNPQVAMKQNLNVLIGMGIGILYEGGIVLLVIFLVKNNIGINLIYGLLVLIFILFSYCLFILLKKLINKQFQLL